MVKKKRGPIKTAKKILHRRGIEGYKRLDIKND